MSLPANVTLINVRNIDSSLLPLNVRPTQVKVFTELGLGMLANAWDGYNCSIFAYGQTSSGKSYSVMGHGANLGKQAIPSTYMCPCMLC